MLRKRGDTHTERLGWVQPPLGAPDRILVFGSHEQVIWSRLEAQAITPTRSTTRGAPTLQQFVESHVGGTRGILDEGPSDSEGTAWTSAFVQLEVVGDEALWSSSERDDPGVCRRLRERSCQR